MGYRTETYAQIANRLRGLLRYNSTGTYVTDLALDYLNRAQNWLTKYRNWSELTTRLQLTLSGNSATLPVDFAKLETFAIDTNGDGKFERYLGRNGSRDKGYYITNNFSKDTGHSFTVTFYIAQTSAPYIMYTKALDDFTGIDTEYSFYPGELLFRCAMWLYLEESKGRIGEAVQARKALDDELRDYEHGHQWVDPPQEVRINDADNNEIYSPSVDLDGGGADSDSPPQYYSEDYDYTTL